jgi:hypothetical protein
VNVIRLGQVTCIIVALAACSVMLADCSGSERQGNTPLPDSECPNQNMHKVEYCNAKRSCARITPRNAGMPANATPAQIADRFVSGSNPAGREDARKGCLAGLAAQRKRTR